jgi:hypothetical protein
LVCIVEDFGNGLGVAQFVVEKKVLEFNLDSFYKINKVYCVFTLFIEKNIEVEFVVDCVIICVVCDGWAVFRNRQTYIGYLFELFGVVVSKCFHGLHEFFHLLFVLYKKGVLTFYKVVYDFVLFLYYLKEAFFVFCWDTCFKYDG